MPNLTRSQDRGLCDRINFMEGIEKEVTTARLETLTDGIFAIAMTLLVLDLRVPDNIHDLARLGPNFFSFIISFLVLGNYWVANHTEFRFIRRSDHKLIWLSIFFNLFISLIPFSASLLGKFSNQKEAVIIYGLNLLLATLVHMAVWIHATNKNRLVSSQLNKQMADIGTKLSLFSIIPYLLAIPFAFVDTRISIIIYALTPIPYILGTYYRMFKI